MTRRVIGILGGSFNPVHNGHLMLASYIAQFGPVDEVWLNLSPQNPFKVQSELLDDRHRLAML
ncbi:nicotinate-nicotinamide nucleotide adenylyltransferase, partial [uncultured Muribaculum sp.]